MSCEVEFQRRVHCAPGKVGRNARRGHRAYLTQGVLKSFCRNQLFQKFVNLSFTVTDMKNILTDLRENRLVQNEFENTLFEIRAASLCCVLGRAGASHMHTLVSHKLNFYQN